MGRFSRVGGRELGRVPQVRAPVLGANLGPYSGTPAIINIVADPEAAGGSPQILSSPPQFLIPPNSMIPIQI